jgi:hypothetical protein
MGTRGLTKVVDRNGVTKVAQYGQWDHYPSGQGVTVLEILLSRYNAVKLLELGLEKCEFVSDAKRELIYAGYNAKYAEADFEDASNHFTAMLPTFSRDTGADILNVVMWSAGSVPLLDESDFENDNLFCEGVYEINYQTNKFISKYGDEVVEFPLNALPDRETYLSKFARERAALA